MKLKDFDIWKKESLDYWKDVLGNDRSLLQIVEDKISKYEKIFKDYKETKESDNPELYNCIMRLCFIIPQYDRIKQCQFHQDMQEPPDFLTYEISDVRSLFTAWKVELPHIKDILFYNQDNNSITEIRNLSDELHTEILLDTRRVEEVLTILQNNITKFGMFMMFADIDKYPVTVPDLPTDTCSILSKYYVDEVIQFFENLKFPGINCHLK